MAQVAPHLTFISFALDVCIGIVGVQATTCAGGDLQQHHVPLVAAQALGAQRLDHVFDAVIRASDDLRTVVDEEAERCNQFFADVVFRTMTPFQQACNWRAQLAMLVRCSASKFH